MMTFEECWNEAVKECAEKVNCGDRNAVEFISHSGEVRKVKFLCLGDETFVAFNSLRRAINASCVPNDAIKNGIVMQKEKFGGVGRGIWVLDAKNAVKLIVRYGKKEPNFKDFFRDNIFQRLSWFKEGAAA